QVEVAAVLEHGAADDHAQPLAGQPEPVHQPVQGRGEHVLVGRLGVRAVRSRERDAVAAQYCDWSPGVRTRRGHFSLRASPGTSVLYRPLQAILPTVLTLK